VEEASVATLFDRNKLEKKPGLEEAAAASAVPDAAVPCSDPVDATTDEVATEMADEEDGTKL